MRTVTEGLVCAKSTPTQVGLVAFLGDIAILVFDNVGARDFKGAIGEWGDDYGIAHDRRLAPPLKIASS